MTYKINDIYPCVQGEGSLAGIPMIMIRLQGCPVGCHFCDTKETWETLSENERPVDQALGVNQHWASLNATQVSLAAQAATNGVKWALISGGEPCIQNLDDLTKELRAAHFKTALETSGTEPITGLWDFITVSPKIGMAGGRSVLREAVVKADEIKWVVGRETDLIALDKFITDMDLHVGDGVINVHLRPMTVALQPLSQNEKATKLCVERCLDRGWRLSIQTHKYIYPDWKGRSI